MLSAADVAVAMAQASAKPPIAALVRCGAADEAVPVAQVVAAPAMAGQDRNGIPMALPVTSYEPAPVLQMAAEPVPFAFAQAAPAVGQTFLSATPSQGSQGRQECLPHGDYSSPPTVDYDIQDKPPGRSTPEQPAPAESNKLLLWGTAGLVALIMLVIVIVVFSRGGGGAPTPATKRGYFAPGAALSLASPAPLEFTEGQSKYVRIEIKRKAFKGPVTVRFEDLPDGVSAGETTLSESQEVSQLRLTVSYGAGPMKHNLSLVASAENLRGAVLVPLTVKAQRAPQDEREP